MLGVAGVVEPGSDQNVGACLRPRGPMQLIRVVGAPGPDGTQGQRGLCSGGVFN